MILAVLGKVSFLHTEILQLELCKILQVSVILHKLPAATVLDVIQDQIQDLTLGLLLGDAVLSVILSVILSESLCTFLELRSSVRA